MKYRKLGCWGLNVSVLSIGNHMDWAQRIPDEQTEEIIRIAYEGGVNFIDTAEAYAQGKMEDLVGKIIKKNGWARESLVLGSKVSVKGLKGAHANGRGLGRKHLVQACEITLRKFNTDFLDLFFCHRPDPEVSVEELVLTMNMLIQQGKILYWGTSDHSPAKLVEMHTFAREHNLQGPHMEQTWYNMLGRRRIEQDLVPLFENFGMGVTAYQPLAAGMLTGKYLKGIPEGSRLDRIDWEKGGLTEERNRVIWEFQKVADDLGVKMPVLALAWAMKNPNVSTVIAGASKPEQVRTNLEAVEAMDKLDDAVMARIAEIQGDRLQID